MSDKWVFRIRRVKCDEAKPECNRCEKFGALCEGYETIVYRVSQISPAALVPKRVLLKASPFQQADTTPLRYQPLEPLFQNDQDYRYFAHFRDCISPTLSGGFDSSLWNRVVLQACESEPSLRQLAVSIAALHKESSPDDFGLMPYTFARMKYGKALRDIRESLSQRQDAAFARTALVAALLIFCFENQYGDPLLAIAHIQSALGLLRKQLSTKRRLYRHLRKVSPTADLEYDLVAAFARLDNNILARVNHVDPTRTYILCVSFNEEDFITPKAFTSIIEAQTYLEHFQFRACPSVPHKFLLDIQNSSKTLDDYLEGRDFSLFESSFQNLSAQLGRWNTAFRPLFDRSRTSEGSKDFLAATILRTQSVSADLILRATHLPNSPQKKVDLSRQARDIIDLSKRAIAHPDFRKVFIFEVGILPSLFCVLIMICFERRLRVEVIQILRDIVPRREAVYDSLSLAEMGERMLAAADRSREKSGKA